VLQSGAAAPEFTLRDLDGCNWSLTEALQEGPIILVFFKISCPTCQFTFPYLQQMADAGVPLIAVSQDTVEDTCEFQQRFGIWLRTLTDIPRKWPASNAFHITSVPSFFVIDPDGTIAASFDGFNKIQLQRIGDRFGVVPFSEADAVPDLRPG
jgi:peroxiredoxin